MSFKVGVLKNFANFTGKHLCWRLFLIKLQAFRPATLLKRDSNTGVFQKICKIFKNIFFTEYFRGLLLCNLNPKMEIPIFLILNFLGTQKRILVDKIYWKPYLKHLKLVKIGDFWNCAPSDPNEIIFRYDLLLHFIHIIRFNNFYISSISFAPTTFASSPYLIQKLQSNIF